MATLEALLTRPAVLALGWTLVAVLLAGVNALLRRRAWRCCCW